MNRINIIGLRNAKCDMRNADEWNGMEPFDVAYDCPNTVQVIVIPTFQNQKLFCSHMGKMFGLMAKRMVRVRNLTVLELMCREA